MALQTDGSRLECLSSRYDDTTAAFLRAFVNSLLDGFLVLCCRGFWLGSKLGDVIVLTVDLRLLDALLYLLILCLVPMVGKRQHWKEQTQERQL